MNLNTIANGFKIVGGLFTDKEEEEKRDQMNEHKYDDIDEVALDPDITDADIIDDDADDDPRKEGIDKKDIDYADIKVDTRMKLNSNQKPVDYANINNTIIPEGPIVKSSIPILRVMRRFEESIVGFVNVQNATQTRRSDQVHHQQHIFYWPMVLDTIKRESDFSDRIVLDTLMTRGALRWAIEYVLFNLQNRQGIPNVHLSDIIKSKRLTFLFAEFMSLYFADNDIGRLQKDEYNTIDKRVRELQVEFYNEYKRTTKIELKVKEFIVPYVRSDEHSPYPNIQTYFMDILRRDTSNVQIDFQRLLYTIDRKATINMFINKRHSKLRFTEFAHLYHNLYSGRLNGTTKATISRLEKRYSSVLLWLQNYMKEGCNCLY